MNLNHYIKKSTIGNCILRKVITELNFLWERKLVFDSCQSLRKEGPKPVQKVTFNTRVKWFSKKFFLQNAVISSFKVNKGSKNRTFMVEVVLDELSPISSLFYVQTSLNIIPILKTSLRSLSPVLDSKRKFSWFITIRSFQLYCLLYRRLNWNTVGFWYSNHNYFLINCINLDNLKSFC